MFYTAKLERGRHQLTYGRLCVSLSSSFDAPSSGKERFRLKRSLILKRLSEVEVDEGNDEDEAVVAGCSTLGEK